MLTEKSLVQLLSKSSYMKNKKVIFAVIAMRETKFFLDIADKLRENEITSIFISFFQPGNNLISRKGYKFYDIYQYLHSFKKKNIEFNFSNYDINDVDHLIQHEKQTFAIKDKNQLINKFENYLLSIDNIIDSITDDASEEIIVFQELGGFIAPLSLYYVTRKKSISHVFFEPAFFKSRIHFILNELSSHRVSELPHKINKEVVKYLKDLNKNKNISIPIKDKAHFQDASISKLINLSNITKYLNKIFYKYIVFQKQEYDRIYNHVKKNFIAYKNRKQISKFYKNLDEITGLNYFFFPFHVPLDYSLTIRSPKYFDQINVIKNILAQLPYDYYLILKEHPAWIGAYNKKTINELYKLSDKVFFIDPNINSHDITSGAVGIITINSKAGAEAAAKGKKVFSLGDSFYSNSDIVDQVKDISQLGNHIKSYLESQETPSNEKINQFFSNLFDETYNGELYDMGTKNIHKFSSSIIKFIDSIKPSKKY